MGTAPSHHPRTVILLDTNTLIYAFDPAALHHAWAIALIRKGLKQQSIAINPVIFAELGVGDASPDTLAARLNTLGIALLDLPAAASPRCAQAYTAYLENRRQSPNPPPSRTPLPDFFIGAHASILNLPIATADPHRYQTYYSEVILITPAT